MNSNFGPHTGYRTAATPYVLKWSILKEHHIRFFDKASFAVVLKRSSQLHIIARTGICWTPVLVAAVALFAAKTAY
jgi:hypothetical protein